MKADEFNPNMVKLVGNTVFEHDGAYLYCDSALLYETSNSVDCFGKVHVKMSDTVNMYGQVLNYDGNTKIANIKRDVILKDKTSTLYCDEMIFDRNTNIASYTTGGRIENQDNKLKSKKGYYYTQNKNAFFRENVVLTNPDYVVNCDTMLYNTDTQISYFFGPTTMKGEDSYIYCEDGQYDRKMRKSRFSKNAMLIDKNRTLTGDSLFYNESLKYGKAKNNVILTDTSEKVIVRGNMAEYFKSYGYSYITDRAVAEIWENQDTLFLHGDTLWANFDTVSNKSKDLTAYWSVKFFKSDLQGCADLLHYSFADSIITMHYDPIIWSEENQMTADTIIIYTTKNKIDKINFFNNAFIISKDTTDSYNQIKGRFIEGFFDTTGQIEYLTVNGNAETIYYVRDDDKNLTGINVAKGSRMKINVLNNKISQIHYYEQPEGVLYPEKDLPNSDRILKGFYWHGEKRPNNKNDIFIKNAFEN